jgi:ribosomal protein L11 methyltransferase
VAVQVPADRGEEARARMLRLVPEGFEEVTRGAALELAAYTDAAGERRLREAFPGAQAGRVMAGWEDAWRLFHRPTRTGPFWVGPPWERPDAGAVAVVIDPGRAFGTGSHPTTRLCLALLLECERTSVLDVGCGSGVLAIAAVKSGFGPVTAVDVDDAAVEATRRNAGSNGVSLAVERRDALADPLPPVGLALANIALATVERLAPRVCASYLVASGYLQDEWPRPEGWVKVARRRADGWAADLFRAASEPLP